MKNTERTNVLKWVIGIICLLIVIAVIVVAFVLDKSIPELITGVFDKETTEQTDNEVTPPDSNTQDNTTENTEDNKIDDTIVGSPEELPSTVVIPTEKDEHTGEDLGIKFPCEIPEYNIVLEKLADYSGMYVEDGLNSNVSDVAMMLVKNKSDYSIEYLSIVVEFEKETLAFDITALPTGESVVVQEKTGKILPNTKPLSSKAMVVRKANMEMSKDKVSVKDNGDNTITIQNLTDKTIPTVRVFYKYYMENEHIYVGGIAFTVRVTRLAKNGKITIQPSHYTSGSCKVVMVLTYDKEV